MGESAQGLMRKENRGTLFWFLGQLGNRLPIYLGAIVLSSVGTACSRVAEAWIVKNIVTAAQTGEMKGVLFSVLLGFVFFVLSRVLWRFSIMRYNTEGWKGVAAVEKQVFSKAMRLPYSCYEEQHSGEFLSRLVYDAERAGEIYSSRLRRLMDGILASIVHLVPMFYYSWRLTLCLLLVSGLSLLGNSLLAPSLKRLGSRLSECSAGLTEKLTNLLSGMEMIKLLPGRGELLADYREANASCYDAQQKSNRLSAVSESLNQFFTLAGSLAFLGLGVWFVSRGLATLGELAAVYTLYGSFHNAFLQIGLYFPQMMNCIANAEKLRQFLDREEMEEVVRKKGREEGTALSVEHLSFSYPGGRKILTDVSFKVEKGICTAVTGESGCGKSTLAKLLLGFYQPDQGEIYLDGPIAYVPQEPYLYQMSIAENIACGRGSMDGVSMEEIVGAAKIANAHDFIMKLPQGYETLLGERGHTLSGGERQRVAIARAVLMGAPILLLDEATSALDGESEQLVNEAVRRISQNCTTIMIAHRESTIAMADKVIQL